MGFDRASTQSQKSPSRYPQDPYAELAPYYDLGMAGFDDDVGLYLGFAQHAKGRILELGCGTGRLLIPLAEAGFALTGVDRSAAMLERARNQLVEESHRHAALLCASVGHLPLSGEFALVFFGLDGFLHLLSREEQAACLRCVHELLSATGVFILDLPSTAAPGWDDWSPGLRPIVPAWSTVSEDGGRIDKLSTYSVDSSTQTHKVTEFYDRTAPDGLLHRKVVEYDLRFVFPAELELLLESTGLRLLERFGDYDLAPFDSESPRQICLAGRQRK